MDHIEMPSDSNFARFYKIKEIPETDLFFFRRNFERNEKTLSKFFLKLVKKYKELLPPKVPLIFVIEDAHCLDEISLELMRTIKNSDIAGFCIITTYQDSFNTIIRNNHDLFYKIAELVNTENLHIMDNITHFKTAHDLMLFNIKDKVNVNSINHKLIDIIIRKSFNGNPLFMIDIICNMVDSGRLTTIKQKELYPSTELEDMVEFNDWSKFTVPVRMEKIIGNMIDSLPPKEIIILKHAAVIGNIFDLNKLYDLNPFNSVTFDDLSNIIRSLENYSIIEILYDINPKFVVCKFSVPFIREILYQRMLIEQKISIHEALAKKLQYSKFSYMPYYKEAYFLNNHLKTAEKTIMHHMNENDDEKALETYSFNSMKVSLVKEICEKLRIINVKSDGKNNTNAIWSGYIFKKSDKGITWEKRFVVITDKRFYYWYYKEDYEQIKMPLGYFDLKNIYSVKIQPAEGNKIVFCIHTSNWVKKETVKGHRMYYFSTNKEDEEEVKKIIATLSFLKVKAIYDEFTHNFGVINLPLIHEIKKKPNKKIKMKFGKPSSFKGNKSSNLYNSIARKSLMTLKSICSEKDNLHRISIRRTSGMQMYYIDIEGEDSDYKDRIERAKESLLNCLANTFPVLIAFIQDIILNIDNVGMNEENRMITIPGHLAMFKQASFLSANTLSGHKNSVMNNIDEQEEKDSVEDNDEAEADSHTTATKLDNIIESRKTENGLKMNGYVGFSASGATYSDEVNRFTLSLAKRENVVTPGKKEESATPEDKQDADDIAYNKKNTTEIHYSTLNKKLMNLNLTLDDDYMDGEDNDNDQ
jgi:hypothetical protein